MPFAGLGLPEAAGFRSATFALQPLDMPVEVVSIFLGFRNLP